MVLLVHKKSHWKHEENSRCFVKGWCWWVSYPTNGYWEHAELQTSNLNHQHTLNIISLHRPKCHQRGKHEAFLRARFFMCRKGGTKSSSFLIQFILNDSFPGVSCLLAFSNLIQLCDIPICLQMRVTTNFWIVVKYRLAPGRIGSQKLTWYERHRQDLISVYVKNRKQISIDKRLNKNIHIYI